MTVTTLIVVFCYATHVVMYPVSYEMYPSCQQLSTTLNNLGQGKKAPMSGGESLGRHGFRLSPYFILIMDLVDIIRFIR